MHYTGNLVCRRAYKNYEQTNFTSLPRSKIACIFCKRLNWQYCYIWLCYVVAMCQKSTFWCPLRKILIISSAVHVDFFRTFGSQCQTPDQGNFLTKSATKPLLSHQTFLWKSFLSRERNISLSWCSFVPGRPGARAGAKIPGRPGTKMTFTKETKRQ